MPTYLNVLNNAILRANLPPSKGNPAAYGESSQIAIALDRKKSGDLFIDTWRRPTCGFVRDVDLRFSTGGVL